MVQEKQRALDILARLGEQPAVAYWERGVASVIMAALQESGLEFQGDQFGNIIAHISGTRPNTAPLALVAHMDHPGFEAVGVQGSSLIGNALGGVPAASFEPGVPLHVVLNDGLRLPATTAGTQGDGSARQVLIKLEEPIELELPRPVVFDLTDFEVDGESIRMRAADDLAGCGSILAALIELSYRKPPGDVYGVFTRAEEVGLIGARLLAESGRLPGDTLIVSVESSRVLPGAEQGGGPVIRVGDAGMTFNADAESALVRSRESLQAGTAGFRAQRQLMSGGICEASAFARYGYRATGIAFPLGNYHNASPEGGVEAEHINISDFLGGILLMTEAAYRVGERENTAFAQRLGQVPEELRQRLTSTNPAVDT